MDDFTSYRVDSNGNIIITTQNKYAVCLDSSDIMKWIDAQDPIVIDAQEDPNILDRIARYAQKKWRQTSHNNMEDDDFRDRA